MDPMQEPRLATREGSTLLRPVGVVLALTFMLLSLSVFSTQTQAHAYWWLAPRAAAVVLPAGAEAAIQGVISGTADLAGIGDGGGGDGTGTGGSGGSGYESQPAKTQGRLGRLVELGAVVFGLGAFEFGWKPKDGLDPAYDDTAGTSGAPAGGTTTADGQLVAYAPWNGVSTTAPAVAYNGYGVSMKLKGTGGTFQGPATIKGKCNDGTAPTASNGWPWAGAATTTNEYNFSIYCANSAAIMEAADIFGADGAMWSTSVKGGWTTTPGDPDPLLTTTTTTQCSGGGSSATSFTWKTADTSFPPITGTCPTGQTVTGVTQQTTRPDGSTVDSPLGTGITTPVVPDAYPECQPLGSCQLVLTRTAVDAQVQQCAETGLCVGWMLQPRTGPKQTVRTATGTDVAVNARMYPDGSYMTCKYGPYTVDNDDCSPVATEPKTQPATDESHCELSDFSLNPVSWVVVPLKCLFIPRDSVVQTQTAPLRAEWDKSAPGQVAAAGDVVFDSVTSLKDHTDTDGCQGPPFTIPVPFMDTTNADGTTSDRMWTIYPYTTCNELTQFVLGFAMPMMTAGTYLSGFFLGTRTILRTVNLDDGMSR